MLLAVSPTSEPRVMECPLSRMARRMVLQTCPLLVFAASQSVLRAEIPASDTRPCRRGLVKMQTGCWWCRPGRNSDELLTFLAHAPPQRRCRNMFSSFLWDTNVQSRSRGGPDPNH